MFLIFKHVLAEQAAQGFKRMTRTSPYRGLEPRGRNTVLRDCWPTLMRIQVAWLLVGAPSGLRLRGEEPGKALPIEFGREVA
jgi:hypothetical protein